MQSAILVGGGQIACHYALGLRASPLLDLLAICDPNPDCLAITQFPDIPLFTDLSKCVIDVDPDLALVATPTDTHFEICSFLLRKGISVLCEKPLAISNEQIRSLLQIAKDHNAFCDCIMHWRYADEVVKAAQLSLTLGQLIGGNITIHDDYAVNTQRAIRDDRIGLAGAWVDSGINALSYLDRIIDIDDIELIESSQVLDSTGKLSTQAHCSYKLPSQGTFDITIDWTKPTREKTSRLEFEKGILEIDHNAQTILLNGEELFSYPTDDRLSSHYKNFFASYAPTDEQRKVQSLHAKLFEPFGKVVL